MIFHELVIENFISYRGEHHFSFNRPPGLYFISGRNEDEPKLGSNGAGKSTIWDAICWCLFGTTFKGLRAGNVIPWDVDGSARVSLLIGIDSKTYWIVRTQNPNSFYMVTPNINKRDITQTFVNAMIRLDEVLFANSVIMGQDGDLFLDLKPGPKLEIFSQILGLKYWEECSDYCKGSRAQFEKTLITVNKDLEYISGTYDELVKQAVTLKIDSENFQNDNQQKVFDILERVIKNQKEFEKHKKALELLVDASLDEKEKEEILEDKWDKLRKKSVLLDKEIRNQELNKRDLEGALRFISSDLKKFESNLDVCPYCNQSVSPSHIKKEKNKLLKQKQEINDKFMFYVSEIKEKEDQNTKLKNKMDLISEEKEKISFEIHRIANLVNDKERLMQSIERELERLDNEKSSIESEINIFEKKLEKVQLQITKRKSDIEALEKQKSQISQTIEVDSFWEREFKELRMSIVAEGLKQLEIEVNNNLLQLGLADWTINFDMQRPTKAGGITTGFQTFITPPRGRNQKMIPWAAWSGGETQRLRLAGTLGLSNLILNRAGITCNIEVWDEKSTALGGTGMDDLVQTLHNRARELGKQIWFIDHYNYDSSLFTETITIVKDENGSHIEEN